MLESPGSFSPQQSSMAGEPRWVASGSGEVPPGAVVSCLSNAGPWFVARLQHEGLTLPAKLQAGQFAQSLSLYGDHEKNKHLVYKNEYEVLCWAEESWSPMSQHQPIPKDAVRVGFTQSEGVLYVGRIKVDEKTWVGQVSELSKTIQVVMNSPPQRVIHSEFELLCAPEAVRTLLAVGGYGVHPVMDPGLPHAAGQHPGTLLQPPVNQQQLNAGTMAPVLGAAMQQQIETLVDRRLREALSAHTALIMRHVKALLVTSREEQALGARAPPAAAAASAPDSPRPAQQNLVKVKKERGEEEEERGSGSRSAASTTGQPTEASSSATTASGMVANNSSTGASRELGFLSCCWVPAAKGDDIPAGAVVVGDRNPKGELYVGRLELQEGDILPGTVVSSHGYTTRGYCLDTQDYCYGPYNYCYAQCYGNEIRVFDFEVLTDPHVVWRAIDGTRDGIPEKAVIGGSTPDHQPIFIGRVKHSETYVTVGKVPLSQRPQCLSLYRGEEVSSSRFDILVHLPPAAPQEDAEPDQTSVSSASGSGGADSSPESDRGASARVKSEEGGVFGEGIKIKREPEESEDEDYA